MISVFEKAIYPLERPLDVTHLFTDFLKPLHILPAVPFSALSRSKHPFGTELG
jgi:hypothetical protein